MLASVRLADVLHVARLRGASDVHLSSDSPATLRLDGRLEPLPGSNLQPRDIDAMLQALVDARHTEVLNERGDVSACAFHADAGALRVHAYRAKGATTVAIRLLHTSVPTLELLQLPPVVGGLADRTRGLVLFSGPTGSGKSTSLAALVDRINATSSRRIITIEDPIEYRHANRRSLITQREIGVDSPSFSDALIGALRADPDVIVLGEMRDAATMRAALTAAETGHLVLATLHTGDAAQSIDRILDAFEGESQAQIRAQLANVLAAVICQRLVTRADGEGRRPAVEVLLATDAVRNIIREQKSHQLRNVIAMGRGSGMQTLEMHLSALVSSREITIEAARGVTDRGDEVRGVATA